MKHTSKQSGRSRNNALVQRAARLGCGISLLAVSAMLAARPARAGGADPASLVLTGVPADSSSAGFVTSGSQQLNTAASVTAVVNDAFGSSTVTNTETGSLPSTASVTGNELAAFATGSGQTNTVNLNNIGTSDEITGISVLAEQQNTFSSSIAGYLGEDETDPYYGYDPTNIESSVTDSGLENETVNPVDGDTLNNSSNLIESQATGNVADSSVNGVVPLNYSSAEPGTLALAGDLGSASGNVVVGSSQTNAAIDGGEQGSYAGVYHDTISLDAFVTGDDAQSLTLATGESDNAISSVFLGNSVNDDIGVDLTSGINTGGPAFAGALVIANQQAGYHGLYGNDSLDESTFNGTSAYNNNALIVTNITGTVTPTLTLTDGAVTEDGNLISAAATGNSAAGANGAPGNEISLGVNLQGATPAIDAGNTINAEGTIMSGGDLLLANQQYQGGSNIRGSVYDGQVYTFVQNLAGSTINLSNNAITASAVANNASNAIETAAGAGINLVSGLAALTSAQTSSSGAYAASTDNFIWANAGYSGGTLNLTNATANLAGDKITTTADGNQVTNSVSLAASTIDAGAAGDATGPAVLSAALPNPNVADAGISLNNLQYSPTEVETVQYDTGIEAYVQGRTISNSSVNVSNPVLASEATGNSATNAIMADGSQGVSGSAGLLNSQAQYGGVESYLDESYYDYGNIADIGLQSLGGEDGISGSSALLSGTELYAEATDNNASNTLDATGGTLSNAAGAMHTLGLAAQLSATPDISAQSVADLALANEQVDFALPAYAYNEGSYGVINVDATAADVSGSSFTVSGPAGNTPTAQALAIGNEAINALSALASTVLSDTAGLVNAQSNTIGAGAVLTDAYFGVNVNSSYDDAEEIAYDDDGGDITDTSITVGTGAAGGSNPNILRALAYGNQASNVLSVSAGLVNPDATATSFAVDGSFIPDGDPFDTGLGGSHAVGAAYDLLSDQSSAGTISAEGESPLIGIYMGNTITNPALTDVTASTDGNAIVASAFGNQASNSATVAVTNVSAEEYVPLADVTNLQSSFGTLTASLSEDDDFEYPLLTTQILGDGAVQSSSLGVTGNTVLTQAEGNEASNSLETTGGNIADAGATALGEVSGATYDEEVTADPLAFSEQNVQYQNNPITVEQTGTNALVSTGGESANSTLTADTNAFEATGYGNNATNSLDFGGTSTPLDALDTSAGLQNSQYAEGDLNVTLGSAGVAAVPAGPDTDIPAVEYTVEGGGSSGVLSDDGAELDVVGEPLTFHVGALTETELTDFEGLFTGDTYYDAGTNTFTLAVGDHGVLDTDLFGATSGDIYFELSAPLTGQDTEADTIPGTPAVAAVPPSPSVLITVAGNINDSTLDVSDNTFNATAVANNAVNTQNIAATSVDGGADISGAPGGEVDEYYSDANADYALVNNQSTESTVTSTANGEAGINPTNTSAVVDSTLNVSGNTQLAEAEGEIASNTLSVAANDSDGTAPTFALVNNQSGDGDVTATAGTISNGYVFGLTVTAPGAINSSTLTMDDNGSEALAVENNATNLLSADVTNLAGTDDEGEAYVDSYGEGDAYGYAEGDYTLTNIQTVYPNTVSATDFTQVVNSDETSVTSAGLLNSTADISGNTTAAFAEANAASNTLDMTSANSTASGALTNGQTSYATVTASGGGYAGFALNGGTAEYQTAAAASSISVTNNSTTVQGIGNQATNALNADTGATYGAQGDAYTDEGGSEAAATYAVLNYQQNTGPVSADATAYYGSELNGAGNEAPVAGTTVTVSYNTVNAKAFGNSSSNSATVAALNSGNATVAVENTQTNTGAVTANVGDTQIGSEIGEPGASNVSVAVGDNSIVASAIGNVATNAIASH